MFCENCGKPVPAGYPACPACSPAQAPPQQYGPPPGYGPQGGAPQGYAPPQGPQGYGQAPQGYGPPQGGPPQYGGPPPAAGGGLAENVAGLLAYITIIPAIIFLLIDPYRRSPFVRFHAFQCICLSVGVMVLQIGLGFMIALTHMGILGLAFPLIGLLVFVLWIMCLVKAYQGEKFKIPGIGDFAEQMANKQ